MLCEHAKCPLLSFLPSLRPFRSFLHQIHVNYYFTSTFDDNNSTRRVENADCAVNRFVFICTQSQKIQNSESDCIFTFLTSFKLEE